MPLVTTWELEKSRVSITFIKQLPFETNVRWSTITQTSWKRPKIAQQFIVREQHDLLQVVDDRVGVGGGVGVGVGVGGVGGGGGGWGRGESLSELLDDGRRRNSPNSKPSSSSS